jgi:serine/threonine-protein kinase
VRIRLYDGEDEDGREAFVRALIARVLGHEAIAPILDFGSDGARWYIVSPGSGGVTLREWLDELGPGRAMPVRFSLPVAIRYLEALEFLHSCGVVHGGVTPESVLCDPSTRSAWLWGFERAGLARVPCPLAVPEALLPYTPPEVLDGRACAASDIYSAAAVLYEQLTGRKPCGHVRSGGGRLAVPTDVCRPAREWNPGVSESLSELVASGLAKEPGERRLTAQALRTHAV